MTTMIPFFDNNNENERKIKRNEYLNLIISIQKHCVK
jgi:hypothetical protein